MDAMLLEKSEYKFNQMRLKKMLWLLLNIVFASLLLMAKIIWMKGKNVYSRFNINDFDINYRDNYYLKDAEVRSYLELKI